MKTVTIERLGHLGDGVAAGPVFVPRALPGEVVTGEIENGRMVGVKIDAPVSDRVRPVCQHYKNCGGCALQHASDDFVKNWKKTVVVTALEAQGLDAPIRRVHTSPPNSRRRATIAARRVKKGVQLGFHGAQTDTICEIDSCQLLRPELLQMLPFLRELTMIGGSRKGRLAITLTLLDDGVDIAVKGGKPLTTELFSQLAQKAGAQRNVVRLSWDDEPAAIFSAAQLCLGNAKVSPPAGAFLQATQEGEQALVSSVLESVGQAKSVADLFSGCGTFALPLAENATVHAVENARDMLDALHTGWRGAKNLKAVTIEPRDLAKNPLRPDELAKYDAIVLDPPRMGAEAQVGEIAKASIARITMVSCNPVTFARDIRVLVQAGYVVEWIDVVDQFRWSPHVEMVACLVRANKP